MDYLKLAREAQAAMDALIAKAKAENRAFTEDELKAFDQILFCGLRKVKQTMTTTLTDLSLLNYVMTSKNEPQSYIWKKFNHLLHKDDRRTSSR